MFAAVHVYKIRKDIQAGCHSSISIKYTIMQNLQNTPQRPAVRKSKQATFKAGQFIQYSFDYQLGGTFNPNCRWRSILTKKQACSTLQLLNPQNHKEAP
jgi:hypothetical protein